MLVGCGQQEVYEQHNDNYGYGYHYDVVGASGLRLRYDPGLPDILKAELKTPAEALPLFEQAWKEAGDCTGISSPAPLSIVVPLQTLFPKKGRAYYDSNTTLAEEFNGIDGVSGIVWFSWNQKHEYVHLKLAASGFPDELNSSHDSPLFDLCAPPPNLKY